MSNTNFPELVNFIQECDVKLFEEGCNSIIDVIGKFIENNDDDSAFYIVNIKKIVGKKIFFRRNIRVCEKES